MVAFDLEPAEAEAEAEAEPECLPDEAELAETAVEWPRIDDDDEEVETPDELEVGVVRLVEVSM